MKNNSHIIILLAGLFLLIAGSLVEYANLWSRLANYTVPWLCSVIAISSFIFVITVSTSGCQASELPLSRIFVIVSACSVIMGAGMYIDSLSYASDGIGDYMSSIGEWLAFTLILAGFFWLPRIKKD